MTTLFPCIILSNCPTNVYMVMHNMAVLLRTFDMQKLSRSYSIISKTWFIFLICVWNSNIGKLMLHVFTFVVQLTIITPYQLFIIHRIIFSEFINSFKWFHEKLNFFYIFNVLKINKICFILFPPQCERRLPDDGFPETRAMCTMFIL